MERNLTFQSDKIILDSCHHPKSSRIQKGKDIVCRQCGIVLGEVMVNSYPIAYNNDEIKKRIHNAPINDLYRQHYQLHEISSTQRHQFSRFNGKTMKIITQTSKDKKLRDLLDIITGGCSEFKISVKSILYKEIIRLAHLCLPINFQGRNKHDLICAIFYIAYRTQGFPVNYKKLLLFFNSRSVTVYRIMELLKDKIIKRKPSTPLRNYFIVAMNEHFPYIAEGNYKIQIFGNRIASILEKRLRTGCNPYTVVAGLIYFICKHFEIKINQLEIATKIGVSDCSLRRWYKVISRLSEAGF